MQNRTVILVSHHVQLCAQGAKYIVALDNGRLQFEGASEAFFTSSVMKSLLRSADNSQQTDEEEKEELVKAEEQALALPEKSGESSSETSSTIAPAPSETKKERKAPRKLVEEEKRAVGRISRDIWETYIWACGGGWYWAVFLCILIAASLSPVVENGWLRCVHIQCRVPQIKLASSGTGQQLRWMMARRALFSTLQFMQSSMQSDWSFQLSAGLCFTRAQFMLRRCYTRDSWRLCCSQTSASMTLFQEAGF